MRHLLLAFSLLLAGCGGLDLLKNESSGGESIPDGAPKHRAGVDLCENARGQPGSLLVLRKHLYVWTANADQLDESGR